MTVKRWVVRRKSDGLYSCSAHGWTPDITLAGFFQDEHLAHLAVDEIKDVIPVLMTLEEMNPYNQQAHRDQVEAMAKPAPSKAGARLLAPPVQIERRVEITDDYGSVYLLIFEFEEEAYERTIALLRKEELLKEEE